MAKELKFHPAAEIFPLMEGESFAELVADIKAKGLLIPIERDKEGRIIDGRNRYRACKRAKVSPRFETWEGNGAVVDRIVSLNLKRRHLNESQRALAAEKLATLGLGTNRFAEKVGVPDGTPISRKQAGAMLNVSETSISRARRVREKAIPEVVRAVERGDMKIAAADRISVLPEEQQREMVRTRTAPPWPKPTTQSRPPTKSKSPARRALDRLPAHAMKRIKELTEELYELSRRPFIQAPWTKVRSTVKELRDIVSRI